MKLFERVTSNIIFSLHILLLVFLLAADRLEFPAWLQVAGRAHPLVLHLPIGVLVLVALMWLFRSKFAGQGVEDLFRFTLHILSLTAVFTAIAGFVLAAEGGYDEEPLFWHRLLGVSASISCWGLLLLFVHLNSREILFATMLWTSLAVLVAGGHFGGSLTHGAGYLFAPLAGSGEAELAVTDSTSLYHASVRRILSAKCFGCHNEKKKKGELVMTSERSFAKGGEDGSPWVPGDPDNSLLMERIRLPEEDDDHMPPKGKAQLTSAEVKLIALWIKEGPDFHTAWTRFDPADSLFVLTKQYIEEHSSAGVQLYSFDFASADVVEALNTPYRTVARIAESEPALRAEFFSAQMFRPGEVQELEKVSAQLVDLSVSRMPVSEEDLRSIGTLTQLERLNLNFTGIDGAAVPVLLELANLRTLSVAGSRFTAADLRKLAALPALKEVRFWDTPVQGPEVDLLRKDFRGIEWDPGYIPDDAERLRLTPPLLANEDAVLAAGELVTLKSTFPGVDILYALGGPEPDSLSGLRYEKPFAIDNHTELKAIACKAGWYCSAPAEFYVFRQGLTPDSVWLASLPDKDYRAEGGATLIDGKKGSASNFRDGAWIAFRQQPMEVLFSFDEPPALASITISFAVNIGSYLMPPASVELWAGDSPEALMLVQRVRAEQPKASGPARIETVTLPLSGKAYKSFKLLLRQVGMLPQWHPGKGQRGWVFVDEVFFDQGRLPN
jgi:hypothetical protein